MVGSGWQRVGNGARRITAVAVLCLLPGLGCPATGGPGGSDDPPLHPFQGSLRYESWHDDVQDCELRIELVEADEGQGRLLVCGPYGADPDSPED